MKKILSLIIISAFLFLDFLPPSYGEEDPEGPGPRVDDVAAVGVRRTYKEGLRFMEEGEYDAAIKNFERALDRIQQKSVIDNDFFANLFYSLSTAYYEKGVFPYFHYRDTKYFAKSVEMATQCLRFKPGYWQAYENLGKVFVKLEEFDKADYYYSIAERLVEPGSRTAFFLARQRKKIQGVKKLKESKKLKKVVPEGQAVYSEYPVLENPPIPDASSLPPPPAAKTQSQ